MGHMRFTRTIKSEIVTTVSLVTGVNSQIVQTKGIYAKYLRKSRSKEKSEPTQMKITDMKNQLRTSSSSPSGPTWMIRLSTSMANTTIKVATLNC